MTCDTLHMLERILKSVTYLLTYLVTDRTKSRDAVASKKCQEVCKLCKLIELVFLFDGEQIKLNNGQKNNISVQ